MKTDKIANQDAVFCCYEQSFEVLLSVFRNVFTFGKSHSAPISFPPRVRILRTRRIRSAEF